MQSSLRVCLLAVASAIVACASDGTPVRARVANQYQNLPLYFEKNTGQTDSRALYISRGRGATLFVVRDGARLALPKAAIGMRIVGADAKAAVEAHDPLPGTSSYLLGNSPASWKSGIAQCESVSIRRVLPGIDVSYHGTHRDFEYDFVVQPNADPRAIRLRFDGAKSRILTDNGDLVLKVGDTEIVQHKPLAWQEIAGVRKPVDARYVLSRNADVRIATGAYDRTQPLIIDPVISYSTFLGGTADDVITGIAVDATGAAYVTGTTRSTDFPVTTGVYKPTAAGLIDAFVTKLSADGTSLVYSTYIGGTGDDKPAGICIDAGGNVYIAGTTSSDNFPTTSGSFQAAKTFSYYEVAFLSKLNPTGTALVYSTYLAGTTSYTYAYGLAVDAAGSAYVVGRTTTNTFPTTSGTVKPTLPSGTSGNGFVTKFDTAGANLVYSTFIGGSYYGDSANAIALDSAGNAYITGVTSSSNFPATTGAFQQSLSGTSNQDIFVAKLNTTATAYLYATYLGGSNNDTATAIAVDGTGAAYVTGYTYSTDFPTTPGSFAPIGSVANYSYRDAFVTKLNATGSDLVYSTFLGGSNDDYANAIALYNGDAFIAGTTSSNNFPTTPGAVQTVLALSSTDAFLVRVNGSGSALSYATFLGSGYLENGSAIALDSSGNVYIAGTTNSANFPVTSGAYQATNPDPAPQSQYSTGTTAGFVTKLDFTSVQQCSISISSTSYAAPLAGGTSSVVVTAPDGCPWEAFITNTNYYWDAPKIKFNGASRGIGNGTLSYTVAPNNDSTYQRSGTIQIGTNKVTITQPAGSCSDPLLTPVTRSFDGDGGLMNVSVMLPSGCSWTALPSAPWIQINSGSPGNGTGTVSIYVAPNDFAARSGSIRIATKTVSVTQTGNGCTANATGTTSFGTGGGTGQMTMTTSAGCHWTAYSLASWLRLDPENTSGVGNGIVPFTVAPNYGAVQRSGTILVGDRTLVVTQNAGPAGTAPAYTISTLAGGGSSLGDGGPALSGYLNTPVGLAYDSAGNLYIADRYNNRVRKVSVDGTISTIAGNGSCGSTGDGGLATAASICSPYGIAVDLSGNVYVSAENRVRKISTNGIISLFAGTGAWGYSGDNGPATSAALMSPSGLACDIMGNVYIADSGSSRIRVISNGVITTVAGGRSGFSGDGGAATSAGLSSPNAVAIAPDGSLYIADTGNNRVRRVWGGVITTVAGSGNNSGSSGDGGAAVSAWITPIGLAFDVSRNLLIVDQYYSGRIRRVTADGVINTIAGGGNNSFSEGAPATSVSLYNASGIATDATGNIAISDTNTYRVRLLSPTGGSCSYVLDPTSIAAGGSGGTAYVGVSTSSNCSWSASSSASWVTYTPASQTGSAKGTLQISSNSGSARTATVTVAGQNVTVSQAASSCTLSISPSSISAVNAAGASLSVAVTAGTSCSWSASSNSDWLTVDTATKSGSQSITVTVAANTGMQRTGSVSIGGQLFSVTQSVGVPNIVGLRFVPVSPCRILDTRNPQGPFGGPAISAHGSRSFVIPNSGCGIPTTAAAFSINVTAVPLGRLNYLTVWPTGKPQPWVSTLNSMDGRIKANAAIVPAGDSGAISIYGEDATHVVVDINGYFVPETDTTALAFYPVTPCRIADTRNPTGTFGGPTIAPGVIRSFPMLSSACALPSNAKAYSLNFTVVPTKPLAYLTTWPTDQTQPFVSTLNAPTGAITANAAIVPAGTAGAISVFATDATDVVIDVNGYFAPAAAGGLSLYNLTPCRILDTRIPGGSPARIGSFDVGVTTNGCSVPAGAKAYVLNATAVPTGTLPFITLWPQGSTKPWVSTLNALDAAITSNMAIVPTNNDSISAYHEALSHLVLDISGYFGQSN